MRCTLLSDAHLNAIGDPRQSDLVSFMSTWQTDKWVFVGDILDFGWSASGTVYWAHVPFWAAVLAAIDRGQSVVWIRGNHDFAMHTQSLQAVGISVVNQWSCKIGDTVLGALHGDSSPDSAAVRLVRRAALGAPGRSLARVVGASRLLDLGHFCLKGQ